MSRKEETSPNEAKPSATFIVGIVAAVSGIIGAGITAYFGYLGAVRPLELSIGATQTAEAKLTASASLVSPSPSLTYTSTPTSTLFPTDIPTPTAIYTLSTTPSDIPTLTSTDITIEVSMQCDVWSSVVGMADNLAYRNPSSGFFAQIQGINATQVVVESPTGESITLLPQDDPWEGAGTFSGSTQGLPQARGTYVCTALDADGKLIPDVEASDVYLGSYELDPPSNVQVEVIPAGILITWDPPPFIPNAFDPTKKRPLGIYTILLNEEEGKTLYTWRSWGRQVVHTTHLIPLRHENFDTGDEGLALEEMKDGVYSLGLTAGSIAPEGTVGYGLESIVATEDLPRIIIEGGKVRVESSVP